MISAQSQNVAKVEERLLRQANDNIETYRKGDAVIKLKIASGTPLSNATVEIKQTSHDFLFGGRMFDIVDNKFLLRPDTYKQRFKNLFNLGILPFYWPGYETEQGKPEWGKMLPVIEWAESNGITLKGHPLAWATRSGAPQWLEGYTGFHTG